jgi:acetaldehyde dehydrogenase / alcohol dehydrogenase
MICIPTTSGTGAEVTPFAVVTASNGNKYPICSYELTPTMAIIDSEFCAGMPKKLTA